jgi:hypothetical protein
MLEINNIGDILINNSESKCEVKDEDVVMVVVIVAVAVTVVVVVAISHEAHMWKIMKIITELNIFLLQILEMYSKRFARLFTFL